MSIVSLPQEVSSPEVSDEKLTAPFPYFGGKRKIAELVWRAFGSDLKVFADPFCGSASILLANPRRVPTEIINDKDYFVANFWRAVKSEPDTVAHYADWPINELDHHTRHHWLVTEGIDRIRACAIDPTYYDPRVAGWWVWGASTWRGRSWCAKAYTENKRIWRQLPTLKKGGILRRSIEEFNDEDEFPRNDGIKAYLYKVAHRLRDVVVTCGDWRRVAQPGATTNLGLTGIFFDPPYSAEANRDSKGLYAQDSYTVSQDVYRWCRENEDDPRLRIILCGYEGEFEFPDTWRTIEWHTNGGYGNTKRTESDARGTENKIKERVWLSPHCLSVE